MLQMEVSTGKYSLEPKCSGEGEATCPFMKRKSAIDLTWLLVQTHGNPLIKREEFAVSLRKQKKGTILKDKR